MKIKIELRQNPKGNWWVNTTYKGYDISEEGKTIEEAKALFLPHLHEGDEPEWLEPKFYHRPPQQPKENETDKHYIRPQKVRIDHNPHG